MGSMYAYYCYHLAVTGAVPRQQGIPDKISSVNIESSPFTVWALGTLWGLGV